MVLDKVLGTSMIKQAKLFESPIGNYLINFAVIFENCFDEYLTCNVCSVRSIEIATVKSVRPEARHANLPIKICSLGTLNLAQYSFEMVVLCCTYMFYKSVLMTN